MHTHTKTEIFERTIKYDVIFCKIINYKMAKVKFENKEKKIWTITLVSVLFNILFGRKLLINHLKILFPSDLKLNLEQATRINRLLYMYSSLWKISLNGDEAEILNQTRGIK